MRWRMTDGTGVLCQDQDAPDDRFPEAEAPAPRHHLSLSTRSKCRGKPMGGFIQVLGQTRMGSARRHCFFGRGVPDGRRASALSCSPQDVGRLVSGLVGFEVGTCWHGEVVRTRKHRRCGCVPRWKILFDGKLASAPGSERNKFARSGAWM